MDKVKGVFITFEGGEGAGKGTQIKLLVEKLKNQGYDVEANFEPGGTAIGMDCRKLLKDKAYSPNPITELFLFEAARSEYVEKIVMPVLKRGGIFISDRFYDSTIVYQGIVRGLGVDIVNSLNKVATNGLVPDLTLVLDVNSTEGVANAIEQSRFEAEGNDFHSKVNQAYRHLGDYFPERRIKVIPRKTIDEVSTLVYSEVMAIVGKK